MPATTSFQSRARAGRCTDAQRLRVLALETVRHLRAFPSPARRVRGAPVCAPDSPHPCGSRPPAAFKSAILPIWSARVCGRSKLLDLAPDEAMDGRHRSRAFPRPCATPSIAAPSGSKARMFEHKDVRVRAGPPGARSAGKLRQYDVAETVVPRAWLWLPKRKVTRAVGRRGKRQGCQRQSPELDSGSRPLRGLVRNDELVGTRLQQDNDQEKKHFTPQALRNRRRTPWSLHHVQRRLALGPWFVRFVAGSRRRFAGFAGRRRFLDRRGHGLQ